MSSLGQIWIILQQYSYSFIKFYNKKYILCLNSQDFIFTSNCVTSLIYVVRTIVRMLDLVEGAPDENDDEHKAVNMNTFLEVG